MQGGDLLGFSRPEPGTRVSLAGLGPAAVRSTHVHSALAILLGQIRLYNGASRMSFANRRTLFQETL